MATTSAKETLPGSGPRAFDLNSEDVLNHWPIAHAIRELIANALDEHHLTNTAEPVIAEQPDGSWVIEDFGRGLRYEHLTQRENPAKLKHPAVIGQFGMGLKDALAVCERRNVQVLIRSPHGDITTERRPKADFPDVVTLHGLVAAPSEPDRVGTRIELTGVSANDVAEAKSVFLRYSDERLLEETKHGAVLATRESGAPGRIYVKGLLVAEEPNFLFSYNVTNVTPSLRAALNRERTNVGRSAYSDRVKAILKACQSTDVAGRLAEDLAGFATGRWHDELRSWSEVAVHACRVLHAREKVVFITPWQVGSVAVTYAQQDGYRPVIVPDDIARRLPRLRDLEGAPMLDLGAYQDAFNKSFSFTFVEPDDLSQAERLVFDLVDRATSLAELNPSRLGVSSVRVSETMRLSANGDQVLGAWDPAEGQIVIRRDQLTSPARFCGTLLHEFEHAGSRLGDGTLAFEEALTTRLGIVAASALATEAAARMTRAPATRPRATKR